MNTPAADRATGDGSADEAQDDFTRSPHGGSGDEERGAVEVQGEGQAADGAATGTRKRRGLRARKTAEELNLLRDPTEKIVELTEPILQELAGAKKLHQLRYPTYVVCTHPNFQLRSIEGLVSIKGTALKELNLSDNKLMVLDSLDQFSTLKILKASRNEIFEVVIEKLPRLKVLDLSHNRLQGIPDLSGFKTLAHLDLSHNLIGTRPESETSPDGWENFKNSSLQQLTRMDLSYNQMNWDQKTFNDQVVTLKEKNLRHLAFVGNPFVEEVEGYRIWILSNCPKIIDVDGEKMSVLERRSRIKDPPAVVKEVKADNTLDEYLGKRVVVKLFEQTKQLMECFDAPDRTLDAVAKVQDKLLQLIPLDPRGRVMFDFEKDDMRDELELLEAEDKEKERSEHGEDFRGPADIIEEYVQTLMLLVERQPAVGPKVLRLLVLSVSLENEGLSQRALEQLIDMLDAGSIGPVVVDTIMATMLPQLNDPKIPNRARNLLLRALHTLADEGQGIMEAMRPLAPTLAGWLSDREPSEAMLGVIASAFKDKKTALELREVPRRAIALLRARETHRWPHARRMQLLRLVQWSAVNNERAAELYAKSGVHTELLSEVAGAVSVPGQFSEPKSKWVEQLVNTTAALCSNSEKTREDCLKAGYVDRLLRIFSSQVNIRAGLLGACLRSLASILMDCDTLMFKKISAGLGGVVPMLNYIQGRRYEQLAELCGEVDERGTVPLALLRNREMKKAIGSVVGLIKVYCKKANEGHPDAIDVSDKLDVAGREQVLFAALEVPDDDLKVLVMECLEEMPLDNLQAPEVANIVSIVADCENLSLGRTEEILRHAFSIMSKLALDDGEEGAHFRRFHSATIHMALDILVRNTGRDTRSSNEETEEKTQLSVGCVNFLRAASVDWPEGCELMQTRDAVDAMMAIMMNEETYGLQDVPIRIERTAVGSSVAALLLVLHTLDIKGEIAVRVLMRMAEVLEGRISDEEIASADAMEIRDTSKDTPERIKQRILQHSNFVQLGGTSDLMRYLRENIPISPTMYTPTGVSARILSWAKKQQQLVDQQKVSTDEKTKDLPDIKIEGYEFLFTPHLHALSLDVANQNVDEVLRKGTVGTPNAADLETTSNEGQAVGASFRVLLALIRYGTEATKRATLDALRDVSLLRTLICLADDVTNTTWYPANVGPNLLLIAQELIKMAPNTLKEDSSNVMLYDMLTVMLRSCMQMLQAKINKVIKAGLSTSQIKPMGEQEERLLRSVVLTYSVMCDTITHMHFADDTEVNRACKELTLQLLLPVAEMRELIKYLYYENLLSYAVWTAEEADAAMFRQATASSLTRLLAEHLCVNEDTRWELLETFARYEVEQKLALRPSFMQTLLMLVQRRMYETALQPHLTSRKIFPEPERVIIASWVRLEPTKKRRLLVVTNRAYYMLREPLLQRCTVCDPHLFCPTGPDPLQRFAFREVHEIALGWGAQPGMCQRVQIMWSRHRVTLEKPAKALQFSLLPLHVADTIAKTIRNLNPLAHPAPMEVEAKTISILREKLLEPATEEVRLYMQVEKLELSTGRVLPRVVVISTISLYLFIEDPSYFLCDPQLTAAERRSGRRDGMKLLQEDAKFRWSSLIEVDFLAGDQAVVAIRFQHGNVQLRFGDDFGLTTFKREVRRLMPGGVDTWRRSFGYQVGGHAGDKKSGACGAGSGADEKEEVQEDDDGHSDADGTVEHDDEVEEVEEEQEEF